MNDEVKDLSAKIAKAKRTRDVSPENFKKDDETVGTEMSVGMRIGIELLAGILVGVAVGYFFDKIFNTLPIFLIIFVLLGFAAGFWNVYKLAFHQQSDK